MLVDYLVWIFFLHVFLCFSVSDTHPTKSKVWLVHFILVKWAILLWWYRVECFFGDNVMWVDFGWFYFLLRNIFFNWYIISRLSLSLRDPKSCLCFLLIYLINIYVYNLNLLRSILWPVDSIFQIWSSHVFWLPIKQSQIK